MKNKPHQKCRAPRPAWRLSGCAIRLAVTYLVLLSLSMLSPGWLLRVSAPILKTGANIWNADYNIVDTTVDGTAIQVKAVDRRLTAFECRGRPGPEFTYDATLDGRLVLIYPVMAWSLLMAWPGLKKRTRAGVLLLSCPFLLLAVFIDLYVLSLWQDAIAFARFFASQPIPQTPENIESYQAVQAGFQHLQAVKSFLSTGGRQFMAVLVCLFSLAPVYLAARQTAGGGNTEKFAVRKKADHND